MSDSRARRRIDVRPPPCPRRGSGRDVDQHDRYRRGDIHFSAHRANGGDQIDHPADLGLGLKIDEAVVPGPARQREQAVTGRAAFGRHPPQLFRDEGRERMQQPKNFIAHPSGHRPRLVLGRAVGALQHGFRQFQIPVAKNVPDEPIGHGCRFVEPIGFDGFRDLPRGFAGLVRDPAIERLCRRFGVEARHSTQWFISAKRQAFHSLVAKLR